MEKKNVIARYIGRSRQNSGAPMTRGQRLRVWSAPVILSAQRNGVNLMNTR